MIDRFVKNLPAASQPSTNLPKLWIDKSHSEVIKLTIQGHLDSDSTEIIWQEAIAALATQSAVRSVVVDASGISYCDISGIALLFELCRRGQGAGNKVEILGLRQEFKQLFDLFEPGEFESYTSVTEQRESLPVEIGMAVSKVWEDMRLLVCFVGELTIALMRVIAAPRRLRWKDLITAVEQAGVNALPIVALISFLVGLIMAFQAVIPMRQFGAEIFVADLIALTMLRELGPLMTAIVLTGRSGSAFAAELGTMKVNEEIDALTTMGLDPVQFLVVPRVIAAIAVTPLLSVFAGVVGVLGGSIVLLSMGYTFSSYIQEVISAATYIDMAGGLFKSIVFGWIVAAIGCLRGLQTKIGATAVGESTTRAVVTGIVLIVVIDGIFSVVYYYIGI
ncbi:MAG: MlaE family lipid ABC transporter permease subunit [Pseudomonadota bacterium]